MSRLKYVFGVLAIVMVAFAACKKDSGDKFDAAKQAKIDSAAIQAYIKAYNDTTTKAKINATRDENGIFYQVLTPGTGTYPTASSTININYTGKFFDGKIFDSGNTNLPLTNYIRGWQLGIPRINTGGRLYLIIPSGLAYGPSGRAAIPPNTPLIFTVDLLSFK